MASCGSTDLVEGILPRPKPRTTLTRKKLTILLLGETGVGKSTFINGLVNYLSSNSLDDAVENIKCLIPTSFHMMDRKTKVQKRITFGNPDDNENINSAESATQSCRCYDLTMDRISLKIIDTPGMGDTRGVEKDGINMRNLLNFISFYEEINAICVLLKPNNSRAGVIFKYCILQLFTHLNKSAKENIIFVFTNSRSTFYEPGDSAQALEQILDEIKTRPPHVEIKFEDNVFCFDNEAFRFLAAISEPNNWVFEPKFKREYENSWEIAVEESNRLIKYIAQLKPHLVKDTVSINCIRTKISYLQKPIADISENIMKEINECEKRKRKIHEFAGDIQDLEKELYIPSRDIITIPLDTPATVCSDPKCREKTVVGNDEKYHYKTYCHKPCYLENDDGNVMGNTGLLDCRAFNKYEIGEEGWYDPKTFVKDISKDCQTNEQGLRRGNTITKKTKSETCFECNHSYQAHLTIKYETKIENKQIRNESTFKRITNKQEFVAAQEKGIKDNEEKINELKFEMERIKECSALFACFLKNNMITPFNDAFEGYIKHIISNERITGEEGGEYLKTLQALLKSYKTEREVIQELFLNEENYRNEQMTSDQINERIKSLFELKHYGKKIKDLLDMQVDKGLEAHSVAKERKVEIGKSSIISKNWGKVKFWEGKPLIKPKIIRNKK